MMHPWPTLEMNVVNEVVYLEVRLSVFTQDGAVQMVCICHDIKATREETSMHLIWTKSRAVPWTLKPAGFFPFTLPFRANFSLYFNIAYLVCPRSQIYLFISSSCLWPVSLYSYPVWCITRMGHCLHCHFRGLCLYTWSWSWLFCFCLGVTEIWSILSYLNLFNFLSHCTSLWFACALCYSSSLLSSLVCRHFDRSALSSHIWLLCERHLSWCVTVCFNMGCGTLKMHPGGTMTEWSVERHARSRHDSGTFVGKTGKK